MIDSVFYILDENKNVVECPTMEQWGAWINNDGNKRVSYTHITEHVHVSTVFLGLNHSFNGGMSIFETMTFGIDSFIRIWVSEGTKHPQRKNTHLGNGLFEQRYATWNEAVEGHEEVCREVRRLMGR